MPVIRNQLDVSKFNASIALPFELRIGDIRLAIQDVYDFFYDVNTSLVIKGLDRLDEILRPAIMSGVLSDMLTASLAKHSRALTVNSYFNGIQISLLRGDMRTTPPKPVNLASKLKPRAKAERLWILTAPGINGCVFLFTR